jgi:hypothetical protein
VGFCLAEALAGRIERDALGLDERAEVGEPSLRAGDVVVHHDEEAVGKILSEGSDNYGVAGAVEPSDGESRCLGGHLPEEFFELGKRFNNRQQLRERHGAK